MTPARLRWGLILIALGVLIIMCNTGRLDWDYWLELATWWPVLLIAIGIEKIFQNSRMKFISFLSPIILVGTMGIVAMNYTGSEFRSDSIFDTKRWSWDVDEAPSRMLVDISHGRNDVMINHSQSYLATGRFGVFSRNPRIDNDIDMGSSIVLILSFL